MMFQVRTAKNGITRVKTGYCRGCAREYSKEHREKNQESYKSRKADWAKRNRDKVREHSKRSAKKRASEGPWYKLSLFIRERVQRSLKRKLQKKPDGVSLGEMVGCSIDDLSMHIEGLFQPGMSWDNWSFRGWHIDHIKPLSSFDLSDPEQLAEACHYSNLRPLWATDNLRKGARLDW